MDMPLEPPKICNIYISAMTSIRTLWWTSSKEPTGTMDICNSVVSSKAYIHIKKQICWEFFFFFEFWPLWWWYENVQIYIIYISNYPTSPNWTNILHFWTCNVIIIHSYGIYYCTLFHILDHVFHLSFRF